MIYVGASWHWISFVVEILYAEFEYIVPSYFGYAVVTAQEATKNVCIVASKIGTPLSVNIASWPT